MPEMLESLVVVAAYGDTHLDRWANYPVQIIRTDLPSPVPEGQLATPYRGYDTGAYLWAYWTIPAKRYLFVQDSLVPTTPDFAAAFFDLLPIHPVIAWMGFPFPMWDSFGQQVASQFAQGHICPERGLFGPIFAATRPALDTLRDHQSLPGIPNHKEAAQGKEREWAMAFEKHGIPIHFLHPKFSTHHAAWGFYPPFRKEWVKRD